MIDPLFILAPSALKWYDVFRFRVIVCFKKVFFPDNIVVLFLESAFCYTTVMHFYKIRSSFSKKIFRPGHGTF